MTYRIVDAGRGNAPLERSIPSWDEAVAALRRTRQTHPGADLQIAVERPGKRP